MPAEAGLEIRYCTRCHWLSRAAWLAQELLTRFERGLAVTLGPGPRLQLTVTLDGEMIFDHATEGHFPRADEIEKRIRDRLDLDHGDR